MPSVKFLGTTDEVTTCEVCGKKNLKKTIAVSIDESDPIYMGSECATRSLGRSLKDVNAEVRKVFAAGLTTHQVASPKKTVRRKRLEVSLGRAKVTPNRVRTAAPQLTDFADCYIYIVGVHDPDFVAR